ncbi:MAG: PIN domain-containing protein [Chitinivibrionia bacterium]|nr:PIN domain-containing protein [Chitinivibrionia bacterium]
MNAILLDTNVFLDYFLNRNGFDEARKIINSCFVKNTTGYVSAHEITTLSYFLEKGISDKNKITEIISKILKTFNVIEINQEILGKALFSNVIDYEDAVIEVSAIEKKIDYIVTKNIRDFEESKVKAILPKDFLGLLEK